MAIPDAPPDPTYYRIVLSDPEGSDSADLTRFLEDCGLRVFRIEIDSVVTASPRLGTKAHE